MFFLAPASGSGIQTYWYLLPLVQFVPVRQSRLYRPFRYTGPGGNAYRSGRIIALMGLPLVSAAPASAGTAVGDGGEYRPWHPDTGPGKSVGFSPCAPPSGIKG